MRPPFDWYAGAPLTARAHVRARWASCPFPALAERVPVRGRVLELGCGHGLFAAYLAATSRERRVTGSDIDADKIRVANGVAERAQATGVELTFSVGDAGQVPAGPWDAIVVADVLYLLPADAQRSIVFAAGAALAPGGALVVKEMGPDPRWKARWNHLQETLAVRVLHITEGGSVGTAPPEHLARAMADAGLEVVESVPLDRGYLHPHHVTVGRRPGPWPPSTRRTAGTGGR